VVESAESSHVVTLTQNATVDSLIGKNIFHSIEDTHGLTFHDGN
jgi:hypothetical protein